MSCVGVGRRARQMSSASVSGWAHWVCSYLSHPLSYYYLSTKTPVIFQAVFTQVGKVTSPSYHSVPARVRQSAVWPCYHWRDTSPPRLADKEETAPSLHRSINRWNYNNWTMAVHVVEISMAENQLSSPFEFKLDLRRCESPRTKLKTFLVINVYILLLFSVCAVII